jgi:hypothetical protein
MSGLFLWLRKQALDGRFRDGGLSGATWDEMSQVARLVVVIAALLYFYGLDRGP